MVSTTIKSDGDTARNVRQILSEHYDLEVKCRHTPDGKDLHVELVLYPQRICSCRETAKTKTQQNTRITDGRKDRPFLHTRLPA